MNRLMRYLLFILIFSFSSLAISVEPDESGIGGTGVSQPILEDEIFNRPEVPEIVDIPELPEISVPDLDAVDAIPEFSRDEIAPPVDASE